MVVGFLPRPSLAQQAAATPNPLMGYIRIGTDNMVTILSAHMDMGQGIYHGIATLGE